MQTVLIVVHLMIVVALVIVVLLQRSEGGALGMGGGSGFMTGRGQANILTRATAILAALFFATSLSLTLLANYGSGSKSILRDAPSGPAETAPAKLPPMGQGSVLDQLKNIERQRATPSTGTATPAGSPAPTTPAPAATPPAASNAPAQAPAEPTGVPDKPASAVTPPPAQAPTTPAAPAK